MEFANDRDHRLATMAMLRYLQPLVRGFEDATTDAGFEIVARRHETGGRIPTPVLELARNGRRLELRLGNALEDFLLVDREAEPARMDARLEDDEYARWKMGEIVASRIELLEIALLPEGADRERRLRDVAAKFEWIRMARRDGDE